MDLSSEEYNTKCAIFPPFHPLRLGGVLAFSCFFLTVSAAEKKQGGSITLLVYTQSRASFPSWLRVPLTSLPAQNRLHSVNTSLSVDTDLGFPLLIGGLAFFCHKVLKGLPLSVSAYGLPHIFLPLLTSFRSACHVRRFRPRCSCTALFIHYK